MTDLATADSGVYTDLDRLSINGEWLLGHSTHNNIDRDPYNGDTLAEIRMASAEDLDAAYAAAKAAQKPWAQKPHQERAQVLFDAAEILERRRQEVLSWLVRESGSTRIKANLEIDVARNIMIESASFPDRIEGRILPSSIPGQESRVYREPLGVVGIISPWNFPLHLTMRSVAPALALGNACVVKPASDTPVTGGLLIARLFEEAGLPPGLLNVVVGAGSEIGDYFVEHPTPRLISFTGSTVVGRGIGKLAHGGKYIKRVALELGGNAPLVVLGDADVEQAAHAAIVGRFLHQGQICISTNRVIVDSEIHDQFVEAVVERARKLQVGNPDDPRTAIGPIINKSQLNGLEEKIENARRDGGRQLVGGDAQGQVLPPHVFDGIKPNWDIAAEESFGPVLPILKAEGEQQALELANATGYGLTSAVFTRDYERGLHFARNIVAGMTHINDMTVDDQANAPFGGEKNSGIGRFNGRWAMEEFTSAHWITLQYRGHPYPF
ncbi:aldehyde dehydrogenase family protein [Hyphomicrobium sp.]|uniref:aldehyde dehydrogenase family protein n=1 Tax=Hyphomicrobium sp. TaxID=82 RepID=UPI002D786FE0|nr:aldehyde dehydrogenase family protein [Hyphomicrobium sp.]HET6388584.1 aldehyde dehydrogenase family protein [Hyphomicrobium sp.]